MIPKGEIIDLLQAGYEGACKVVCGYSDKLIAAFPSAKEARSCANYATTFPDGGWDCVEIIKCSNHEISHQTFMDWL